MLSITEGFGLNSSGLIMCTVQMLQLLDDSVQLSSTFKLALFEVSATAICQVDG